MLFKSQCMACNRLLGKRCYASVAAATPTPSTLAARRTAHRSRSLSLPELLQLFSTLKNDSRRPTPSVYQDLVRAAADEAARGRSVRADNRLPTQQDLYWRITTAALQDAHNGQIDLPASVFDQLLRFTDSYPGLLPSLLLDIPSGSEPSHSVFSALARHAIASDNLEQIVMVLHEMLERNIMPTETVIRNAVRLCCEWGCPRLALELVQKVENNKAYGGRVEVSSWAALLACSAENQYLAGVEIAWERIVRSKAYTPDEGVIMAVLAVAGRWGKPRLASMALEILPSLSILPSEHHLVPLLEAYVNAGQVPNAIEVLTSIRSAGMIPSLATAEPIVSVLTNSEVIDQAFYALEDMRNAGQTIDVTALNAVIEASARLGDLQRARATQLAAPNLGVSPDVNTFNAVLGACVKQSHRQLGDAILSEMSSLAIAPNGTTYRALISLCLTQPRYEDAFFYLEKMKAEGHRPPYETYRDLVTKCFGARDRRWRLVVEELESLGYRLERSIKDDLERRSFVGSNDDRQ